MMQILSGGAPCQQIDSEEDDDQEAEPEDEVSYPHTYAVTFRLLGPPKTTPADCHAIPGAACVYSCGAVELRINASLFLNAVMEATLG